MNRKWFWIAFSAMLMIAVALTARTQNQESTPKATTMKIAVADIQEIFDKYLGTQAAQIELEDHVKALEEEGKKMQSDLDALQEKYDKQRIFIDDKKKEEELLGQIDDKKQEIKDFIEKGQQQIEEKRRELMKPILKEIDGFVQDFAKREGADLIIDRVTTLYIKPEYDLTNRIIEELNKKYLREHPNTPVESETKEETKSE